MNFSFPKNEKLKSRKLIETLFSEGKSFRKFPLKVIFLPVENTEITKAAFAVPKRNFKLAVDRNRIKRQMRESYRLNKQPLLSNNETKFALLFLYLSRDKTQYDPLESAIKELLQKIGDENI